MDKLFVNIRELWTPVTGNEFGELNHLRNMEILVRDGLIEHIAQKGDIRVTDGMHIVDCKGLAAIPGFVDPHTHPVFYRTREEEFIMRSQGKSYEEIAAAGGGIRNSARKFREASFDELRSLTEDRINSFLEYGTTTIEAKSGYGLSVDDEIKSLKIIQQISKTSPLTIVPTFLGAHETPDEYRNNKNEYIRLICEEMIPAVAGQKLAVFCDVFCEKDVFDIEESRRILETAKSYGLIPKLHADELHAFGGAELAAEVGAVSADHLLKVSAGGINAMKEAGVVPVILPGTAFFLGKTEYAPVPAMRKAQLPVALATDYNPGSSYTQNMQFILTLAAIYLHLKPGEYLDAGTRIAARAIKMEKLAGTLEKGKMADFILTDVPNLETLAYNYATNHVRKVFKKGELVVDR